ncbi:MAG: IPT/TIG domain-containing protein [Verrucomicrobiales bacterium]|nr:IPT/TIG domain-containing protein [Verrucomicrobiales bacterium]
MMAFLVFFFFNGARLSVTQAQTTSMQQVFFIEAEDFDYDAGQHLPAADTMPYFGGAYAGRSAQAEVDYHDPGDNENPDYRSASQSVAIIGSGDVYREGYDAKTTYRVAWNHPGDWYNYTRDFPLPARDYHVYVRLSSGAAPNAVRLDEVVGGHGTPAQQMAEIGSAQGPASGAWDYFLYVPVLSPAGHLAQVHLGGRHTLRLTNLDSGSQDINYLVFVPILSETAPHCAPNLSPPVAWWSGEGHALDQQSKFPGTLKNGAAFTTGRVDEAFSFDGIDDYVETTLDVQPSAMPTMTWEAWVLPTRSGGRQQILSADDGNYDRSLLVEGTRFGVFTGWGVWTPALISFNQWQHVAVVFSPTNLDFYKNGERFTLGQAPSGQASGYKLQLGRNPGYGEYFQGRIDEVSVYDRALSTAELQAIVAAGSAGKCTGNTNPTPTTPPVIDLLDPAQGPPGSIIHILGSGFDPVPASNNVSIGGVRATVIAARPLELFAYLPPSIARGSQPLVVSTATGTSASVPFSVTSTEPPPIAIRRTGNAVAPGWSASADGFSLESTSNLSPPIRWTPVNGPSEVVDGTQQVRIPTGEASRFFRLRPTDGTGFPQPTTSVGTGRITAATGGTVTTPDQTAALVIPPGALERDIDIQVTSIQVVGGEVPVPGGDILLDPDGLVFAKPATLKVRVPGSRPPGHRLNFQLVSSAHTPVDVGGEISYFETLTNLTFDPGTGQLEVPLRHFSTGVWNWSKDLYAVLDIPGRYLEKGDLIYVLTGASQQQGGDWLPGHCGLYLGTRSGSSDENDGFTLIEATQTKAFLRGVVRFDRLDTGLPDFKNLEGTHIYMGARRPADFELTREQRNGLATWAIGKIDQGYWIIGGGAWYGGSRNPGYTCVGLTELAYEFGAGRSIVPSQASRVVFTPFRQFQATLPVNTATIKVGETFDCKVAGVVNRGTPVSNDYYTDTKYYTRSLDVAACDDDAQTAVEQGRAKFEPIFGQFTFTPVAADAGKDFKFAFLIDATASSAGTERTAMIVQVEKTATKRWIRQDPPVIQVSTFQGSGSATNLTLTDQEACTRGPSGSPLRLFWEPPPAQVAAGSTFSMVMQSDGGSNPADQVTSSTAPPRLFGDFNQLPGEFDDQTAFAGYQLLPNCNVIGSSCYRLVARPAQKSFTVPAEGAEDAEFRGIRLEFRVNRSFGPFNPGEIRGTLEWNYLPAP